MLCNIQGLKCCSEIDAGITFTINRYGSFDNQQESIENNLEHEKASFEPLTGKSKKILEVQFVCLKTT